MLVKDLYLYSLEYEMSQMAHFIYYLLSEKKISLDDDSTQLERAQADLQKVKELFDKNVLGIRKICIYSLKMNHKDFVYIFAATREEAIHFYTETFQRKPLNCHVSLLDYQFYRGKDVISFRDMRREFEDFPAIAGYFTRE
ncbi:hypothetical protein [Neobacillus niacini]|uniref:hypothetical protein n=1 Tax=Neobacillus niacini TaxID=86668 RepID=UPI003983329D